AGLIKASKTSIKDIKITPENLAELVVMIRLGKLSSRGAKDMLVKMFETGGDPSSLLESMGVAQISDEGELKKIVMDVIEGNPNVVADYKNGKAPALEALIGRAMGKLKGKGNPAILRKLFLENIA
ncbi:MAG TPA: Asp-tRNA(Asn)/Glu-tRNA(Gln) amidotransferase GatCAB subunit B, partial [Candidatus Paceibacterota bacterium]